jgi:hypothetical protein
VGSSPTRGAKQRIIFFSLVGGCYPCPLFHHRLPFPLFVVFFDPSTHSSLTEFFGSKLPKPITEPRNSAAMQQHLSRRKKITGVPAYGLHIGSPCRWKIDKMIGKLTLQELQIQIPQPSSFHPNGGGPTPRLLIAQSRTQGQLKSMSKELLS